MNAEQLNKAKELDRKVTIKEEYCQRIRSMRAMAESPRISSANIHPIPIPNELIDGFLELMEFSFEEDIKNLKKEFEEL